MQHRRRHLEPRLIGGQCKGNEKRGGESRRRARPVPKTETRDDQRLVPIVENFVDRLLASRLKPTAIVATITPAIRPYSRAVTARRSNFSSSQVFAYSIMVNSHRYIAQMRLPGICFDRTRADPNLHAGGYRGVSMTGKSRRSEILSMNDELNSVWRKVSIQKVRATDRVQRDESRWNYPGHASYLVSPHPET